MAFAHHGHAEVPFGTVEFGTVEFVVPDEFPIAIGEEAVFVICYFDVLHNVLLKEFMLMYHPTGELWRSCERCISGCLSAGCAPLRALASGYAWFRAPRGVASRRCFALCAV